MDSNVCLSLSHTLSLSDTQFSKSLETKKGIVVDMWLRRVPEPKGEGAGVSGSRTLSIEKFGDPLLVHFQGKLTVAAYACVFWVVFE